MSGAKSRVRATLNPDPDHWVRRWIDWWIDENGYAIKERSGVIRFFVIEGDDVVWADASKELTDENPDRIPKSFTFIASSLQDNKILMDSDPQYLANLMAMTRVERAQLLDGNWNIRASAGTYFKRSDFEVIDAAPVGGQMVRAWDQAGTKKKQGTASDPDWTVGVKMLKADNGIWYILGMERFREDSPQVDKAIKNTAFQDGKSVKVRLAQDPGQAGKSQARSQTAMLSEYDVVARTVSGDKEVRARPFASQSQAGNVKVIRGGWNEDFFKELESFPDGSHDDIVDAASDAFDELNVAKRPRVRSL
jgi:predicted phage terminase large subunit-like protein